MHLNERRFLFLQGPHGPFFGQLAGGLRAAGSETWKVAVTAGDAAEWNAPNRIDLIAPSSLWRDALELIVGQQGITDLVLYGQTRPLHRLGLEAARSRKVRTHILEEGYIRPNWITHETMGSNDCSPAAEIALGDMSGRPGKEYARPKASWGALRHHVWYGALYHARLMAGARRFPMYRSHRDQPVWREAVGAFGGLLALPGAAAVRVMQHRRAKRTRRPLYVLLLQLQHDSALAHAGPWACHAHLLDRTLVAFAQNAPQDARLAVKMHPLEAEKWRVARQVRRAARLHGLTDRVLTIPGGRLADLLDQADAALTVSSTAGQQVLWRGLPLFAFGRTVYSHPELLPQNSLPAFMAHPEPPDLDAYAKLRAFLFRTSQVPGCFYTARGRADAVAGLMSRLATDRSMYDTEVAHGFATSPVT
ncbi:MAG: capsule biosynthesis protein CapA [Pseudomonadota bacterium]